MLESGAAADAYEYHRNRQHILNLLHDMELLEQAESRGDEHPNYLALTSAGEDGTW